MSLVDYASSDEEEDNLQHHSEREAEPPSTAAISVEDSENDRRKQPSTTTSSSSQPSALPSQSKRSSLTQESQDVSPLLPPPIEKLPDASMLLNSPMLSQPVGTDHSSRVAAAMAENASRKREANGSSSSNVRGKIPRGTLPHSKNIPETSSGQLVPPQLRGRSNVVTEDISKLFVRKSPQGKS